MLEEEVGNLGGGDCGDGGYCLDSFRQLVDDHEDRIMSIFGRRQLCDEVHGDNIPFSIRDQEWLQHTCSFLVRQLIPLVFLARIHIFFGVFDKCRPEELSSYKFEGASLSEVSCARGVVVVIEDILLKISMIWNIDLLLVIMQAVWTMLIFVEVGVSGISFLHCLRPLRVRK